MDTPNEPAAETTTFSTDTSNLEDCLAAALVALADGDIFDLRIAPVVKQLGDHRVRMLAYNGSIPGPTLWVSHGSEISVRVRNANTTRTGPLMPAHPPRAPSELVEITRSMLQTPAPPSGTPTAR